MPLRTQSSQPTSGRGHLAAFGSYEKLAEFVESDNPILNKLGLIVNTRNGIANARMILDTKQSNVEYITSQAQRVVLPRLSDAILQLLLLLSMVMTNDVQGVEAFVLDFSDAFWQIPILS